MAAITIEELEARQSEIRARLNELHEEYRGQEFSEDTRGEWNDLNAEIEKNDKLIEELTARETRISELVDGPANRESGDEPKRSRVDRKAEGNRIPSDIFAVADYRNYARSVEELPSLYREGAERAVDQAVFPHERAKKVDVQEHIQKLLERDAENGELAQRILLTGTPTYRRAFKKKWAGHGLNAEEERALSLTTTAGGFAVPYQLDPSIIPTSNGSVNPLRAISRVEQVTSNEWRGVSSAGVTATYRAEGAEVGDNAPVLAQPVANPERCDVFIPFSIEIGQDWGSMESEMARLVQDAKDDVEATKFITGLGHTSNEPEGLLVGGTAVVSTAAATTLAVGDLYSLDNALPPRFQPRASIIGSRTTYSRVRAIDTTGGSTLWVRIGDGLPNELLGYPSYEASVMPTTLTSASSILTIGDFSYFLIADRIGMNAELVPHLFHTSNNRPSGQRGLLFYWRNTSDVLAWQAFRTLKVT